jgi:hypothetical protein
MTSFIILYQAPSGSPSDEPGDMIAATLPTRPSDSLTLMPCGWNAELVRSSCTVPRVRFPLRWSPFWMISTVSPGRMFARCRAEVSGVMITYRSGRERIFSVILRHDYAAGCRGRSPDRIIRSDTGLEISPGRCPPAVLPEHQGIYVRVIGILPGPEQVPLVSPTERRGDTDRSIRV